MSEKKITIITTTGNNNRDKLLEMFKNKFEIKTKDDGLGIILAKKI